MHTRPSPLPRSGPPGDLTTRDVLGALLPALIVGWSGGVRVVLDDARTLPHPVDHDRGGDLGRAVLRAHDQVWGRPDRLVVHVIGDVPPWLCPTAAGWLGGETLDPVLDGAILTILDLPRSSDHPHSDAEVTAMVRAHGRASRLIDVHAQGDPKRGITSLLRDVVDEIAGIQQHHRSGPPPDAVASQRDPPWPVVVLRDRPSRGRRPDVDGST